jgi:RNA polymerase sigma-70 factor (ECF subfamily)
LTSDRFIPAFSRPNANLNLSFEVLPLDITLTTAIAKLKMQTVQLGFGNPSKRGDNQFPRCGYGIESAFPDLVGPPGTSIAIWRKDIMNPDQSCEIQALVTAAAGGDRDAMSHLFEIYQARLRQMIALRIDPRVKSRIDPSDVLQEAYLDVSRKLEDYTKKANMSFYVWLRLVTGERLLKIHRTHLRTEKRDINREQRCHPAMPDASSVCLVEVLANQSTSASQRVIRKEAHDILKEALDEMDLIDREVLVMRHFENLSNQEVAETMGITKTAASNRYIRAMKRLKTELERNPECFL